MGDPYANRRTKGQPDGRAGYRDQKLVLQRRYEVIDQLGQGGMGTVYLTRDLRLHGRTFVVKKLRDDFFRDEDKAKAMEFFMREIEVLSRLSHPNIVDIKDHFPEGDDYYIVMEYVEGKNLHEMLHERGEPFPEDQVMQWARQICQVLEYLHTNEPPVIYRDLKPSNIMIDTLGRVKLVDFGIARQYRDDSDNTHVVSAGYSPPEQYWGAAEPRSDIYALGATMYFLLTGQEPLALQTSTPAKVIESVSEHVDFIVSRATAQDIWLRFQSAAEMLEELEAEPETKKGLPSGNVLWGSLIGVCVVAMAAAIIFVGWHTAMMPKRDAAVVPQVKGRTAEMERKLKEAEAREQNYKVELQTLRDHMRNEKTTSESAMTIDLTRFVGTPTAKAKEPEILLKEDSEAQLTDPEGLAPVEEEPPRFGFPLFRSTDIK